MKAANTHLLAIVLIKVIANLLSCSKNFQKLVQFIVIEAASKFRLVNKSFKYDTNCWFGIYIIKMCSRCLLILPPGACGSLLLLASSCS